jgi:hypothetical protein
LLIESAAIERAASRPLEGIRVHIGGDPADEAAFVSGQPYIIDGA